MLIKISSKALGLTSRLGRYHPYHRPSTNTLGPSDSMYVRNNAKDKKKNISSKRYVDIDYSYERMELRDRLMDMNPAPPPYANIGERYDLNSNPNVPITNLSDDAYGHKDEPKPKPNPDPDVPKPEPEPEPTPTPVGATKEEWEAQYKQYDGTYNMVGIDYERYENPYQQQMDENIWSFLSNYLHFEQNYTFPNSTISQDTPIRTQQVIDEDGSTNWRFIFNYKGGEAWFTVPTSHSIPAGSEPGPEHGPGPGPGPGPEPEPEPEPAKTVSDWEKEFKAADGSYILPDGLFAPYVPHSSTDAYVLNDAQWEYLRFLVESKNPTTGWNGSEDWVLPPRDTPIRVDLSTSNYVLFAYITDPTVPFASVNYKIFNVPINLYLKRIPGPTPEQQYNLDLGSFDAKYRDPSSQQNLFFIPKEDFPSSFKTEHLNDNAYAFIQDYIKFYAKNYTFDRNAGVFIDYIRDVTDSVRIIYRNPSSPKESVLSIPIPKGY